MRSGLHFYKEDDFLKHKLIQRALSLLLVLVCVMGVLPLSAFAAEGLSSAPGSITQKSSDYMKIGGQSVRYKAASSAINNVGLPYVFNEQVDVPGFGATRALCAYQKGTLGPAANGQKWNFSSEVNDPSLKVLLTYIYAHTYGNFTDAGNARGLETWTQYWSDIWFLVAQAGSWLYEHGVIVDVNSNREGFIEQMAEEFIAAMKLYHRTYGQSSWIKDWDAISTHSIIDSSDGGKTGYSAYDYIKTGVDLVLDHPEYYHKYHLWLYDWDKSQPWKLAGQSGVPMQRLLIAVPGDEPIDLSVQLTVKKLEAGTNKPLAGVTFKIEDANDASRFSVTKDTGADGTITLTQEADGLTAGQYIITEEAVPEGYVAQTASQVVTVMPNSSASNTFVFYNEPNKKEGDGSIRKVDADNPTVGIPGAVIRITSVKLDDGGSYFGEFVTKDGGYILKEDLDFSKLPTGAFLAEEITPPEGFILSSDVSKVKQPFVWDGEHDVSLVFENSSKVKVQLKKVDESGSPLPGAVFLILRDGQIIGTEETQADGTITVSNVVEGHYEFVEVSAPAGFDCDKSPVGVHVNAEDLQGEQTITVTKVNHHKRTLTIQKRDAETGDPIPNTSFHVRGINIGYENDVVTGADGKAVLESMPSGCYEVEELDVPKPYLLDTNNRKTVWIDSEKDKDIVVDFVNSTRPGIRLLKLDGQTGKPVAGATFLIEEVNGGFSDRRQTDKDGLIVLEGKDGVRPGAYKITEVAAAPNYVLDDTVHIVQLEENKTCTIELTNIIKPTLKILKVDSITKSPIGHVKFQIWRGSDDTVTGELNDLGVFYTNEAGEIVLEHIDTGWYRIRELESAPGFTIKAPDTQDIYLKAGETHEVQFENVPKNAIVVEKYDSVSHEPLSGVTFQLRWLGGASGTGGTVIGQKKTGPNGTCMWTGLNPGSYIVEEVDPGDGYTILQASETVFLADSGEQSVVTVRFENAPDGSLLIRKVCATNPSITLANAEFKVTYSDGTLIGDSNGIFRSDENGEVRISGLKPDKTVIVTEVTAPPGFIKDTQSQSIQIKAGKTVSITMKNQPKGKLIIQKRDSATNRPLSGAEFRISTAAGCEVGLDGVIGTSTLTQNGIFVTDAQGEIRITNLAPGAYVLTEIKAPDGGYVIDTPSTNVVIGQGGDTQTVVVKNSKAGSLVILKQSSLDGKPLEGVEFKVTTSTGEFVPDANGQISSNGLYYTNKDGKITINGVVGTLVVTETRSIPGYSIDPNTKTQTVVVNPNDTQTLRFYNTPSTTLVIEKYIEGTTTPLKGVTFLVTDSSGAVVGNSNGEFITDENGRIVLEGLEPGTTVTAKEIKTVEGYVLDTTPKSIKIKAGEVQTLRFYNQKQGGIVIKKLDSVTKKPLSGVQFLLTYADGSYVDADNGHLSSKGLYTTDANGEIRLTGIVGTLVISEVKPLDGYVVDPATQNQTVQVNASDTQYITVYNTPIGGVELIKVDAADKTKRLGGVTFEIRKMDGGLVQTVTTGSDGRVHVKLDAGDYYALETEAKSGYKLDPTPHYFTVKDGKSTSVTITNEAFSGIILHKINSVTKEGIYGVKFLVYDQNKNPIGEYTTDDQGYIYIDDLTVQGKGRLYIRELEAAQGYELDKEYKTVYIQPGKTVEIEWENTPITGQFQIRKYAAEYNEVTGTPAGAPLKGAVYEISEARSGKVVDYITTDARGVAASKPLPLGRYKITEVTAPPYWKLSGTVFDETLEYSGQIIKLSDYDKPSNLGVIITKRGNAQVLAGSQMRYDITVANTSNVALSEFYWHDRIPTDAVRGTVLTTGTYSARLNYRVLYKTNYRSGYQVLASNLLTSSNYSFSLNAIPTQPGEYVTDVYFDFGKVPVGFQSTTNPTLTVQVLGTVANNYQIINRADVGGKYQGTWQTAQATWLTIVRRLGPVPTLPQTGY
jgi:uncharacterized surface anchored protein